MASINAENVAKDVLDSVRKGKKVVFGKIMRKHGYAKSVSVMPQKVTQTKSYQNVISPILESLERSRDKAAKALEDKDLTLDKSESLANIINKLTHDIQLLSGGKTEDFGAQEDRKSIKALLLEFRGR